jgi:hypothetical protein
MNSPKQTHPAGPISDPAAEHARFAAVGLDNNFSVAAASVSMEKDDG